MRFGRTGIDCGLQKPVSPLASILGGLRANLKLLRARSLSDVSEAPTSEELGVGTRVQGRFGYSDLKEAAPRDYGICIWMSPS